MEFSALTEHFQSLYDFGDGGRRFRLVSFLSRNPLSSALWGLISLSKGDLETVIRNLKPPDTKEMHFRKVYKAIYDLPISIFAGA